MAAFTPAGGMGAAAEAESAMGGVGAPLFLWWLSPRAGVGGGFLPVPHRCVRSLSASGSRYGNLWSASFKGNTLIRIDRSIPPLPARIFPAARRRSADQQLRHDISVEAGDIELL